MDDLLDRLNAALGIKEPKKERVPQDVDRVSSPRIASERRALEDGAKQLGIDPRDYATAISYETAGTFDPWKAGPVTKWGQHRGTIQYGEPQRKQFGVYEGQPFEEQVTKSNVKYLKNAGVKPGMTFDQIYTAINGGSVKQNRNTQDADTGRTITDNIRLAQRDHRAKALKRYGWSDDDSPTPAVDDLMERLNKVTQGVQADEPSDPLLDRLNAVTATTQALPSVTPTGLDKNGRAIALPLSPQVQDVPLSPSGKRLMLPTDKLATDAQLPPVNPTGVPLKTNATVMPSIAEQVVAEQPLLAEPPIAAQQQPSVLQDRPQPFVETPVQQIAPTQRRVVKGQPQPVQTPVQQAPQPRAETSEAVTAPQVDDGVKVVDDLDPNGIAGEINFSRMPNLPKTQADTRLGTGLVKADEANPTQELDTVKWAMDDIAQGLETKFQIPFRVGRAWIEKYGIGSDPRQGDVRNLSPSEIAANVKGQKAFALTNRDLDDLLRLTNVDRIYQEGRDKGLVPSEAYKGLLGQGLIPDEDVNGIIARQAAQETSLRTELQDVERNKIAGGLATIRHPMSGDVREQFSEDKYAGAINAAADEQFKKILTQYGSIDNYRSAQEQNQNKLRAIKAEREEMSRQGIDQYTVPLQALSNIGQSAVEMTTDLLAGADVATWALGVPTVDDIVYGLTTGERRNTPAHERNLYEISQGFQKWWKDNSYDDPLLQTSVVLNDIPKVLTQVVMQAAAGAVTGGASLPTALGATSGMMERYKEAVANGASPTQLRAIVATSAALAVPEFVVNKLIFAPLLKTGKMGAIDDVLNKTAKSLFAEFSLGVGEAEAKQLTKSALTGLAGRLKSVAQKTPELLKMGGTEAIQEVWLEDKINNAVAYATHDPSQTRWNQVQFLTQDDLKTMGISALAGAAGHGVATVVSKLANGTDKLTINGKAYDVAGGDKTLLRQALGQYDVALEKWQEAKVLYEEGRKQKTQEKRREWREAARNAYTRGIKEFETAEEMYQQVQDIVGGEGSRGATPLIPVDVEAVQRRERKPRPNPAVPTVDEAEVSIPPIKMGAERTAPNPLNETKTEVSPQSVETQPTVRSADSDFPETDGVSTFAVYDSKAKTFTDYPLLPQDKPLLEKLNQTKQAYNAELDKLDTEDGFTDATRQARDANTKAYGALVGALQDRYKKDNSGNLEPPVKETKPTLTPAEQTAAIKASSEEVAKAEAEIETARKTEIYETAKQALSLPFIEPKALPTKAEQAKAQKAMANKYEFTDVDENGDEITDTYTGFQRQKELKKQSKKLDTLLKCLNG